MEGVFNGVLVLCCLAGEGQFGKVYTAVNLNNGELMAMKVVRASV